MIDIWEGLAIAAIILSVGLAIAFHNLTLPDECPKSAPIAVTPMP